MTNKKHITRSELGDNVYVLNDKQLAKVKALGYQPFAYNAGVYGWNYDVYLIGGEYMVNGYRPLLKWLRLSDEQLDNLLKQNTFWNDCLLINK